MARKIGRLNARIAEWRDRNMREGMRLVRDDHIVAFSVTFHALEQSQSGIFSSGINAFVKSEIILVACHSVSRRMNHRDKPREQDGSRTENYGREHLIPLRPLRTKL